jgi:hypothetical protein
VSRTTTARFPIRWSAAARQWLVYDCGRVISVHGSLVEAETFAIEESKRRGDAA